MKRSRDELEADDKEAENKVFCISITCPLEIKLRSYPMSKIFRTGRMKAIASIAISTFFGLPDLKLHRKGSCKPPTVQVTVLYYPSYIHMSDLQSSKRALDNSEH